MQPLLGAQLSSSTPASTPQLLATLRKLLVDCVRLRFEGGPTARLAQAQGYADGYMRVLLDLKVINAPELLTLIAETRRGELGPATGKVTSDSAETPLMPLTSTTMP